MKATYKFILAAFAATVALASCTKDIAADKQDTESQDGLRKIAISFDTPTKTYLNSDNVRPIFKDGDWIKVSNGKNWEDQVVVVDGDNAFFKTSLAGQLTAVYPHKAAVVNPKTNEMSHTEVLIEKEQTGLFEDANIAIGTLNGDGTMTFHNKTAVLKFYVGQEIGVQTIEITSKGEEMLATPDGPYGKTITVNVAALQNILKEKNLKERICYVAVAPHDSINFDVVSTTNTQDSVKREFTKALLSENTLTNVFIPYFIDVNGQKWGYCNVGAFLPEEPGLYFAWGDVSGARYLPSEWEQSSPFFGDNGLRWFNWEECPFNGGESVFSQTAFNNNRSAALENGILKPDYDAAYKAWGEGWRMPTKSELENLIEAGENTYEGGNFIVNASLCLPVTGTASYNDKQKTTILSWDGMGMYWSSSLCEPQTGEANSYCFEFGLVSTDKGNVIELKPQAWPRNYGLAIRPIFGPQSSSETGVDIDPITNLPDNI